MKMDRTLTDRYAGSICGSRIAIFEDLQQARRLGSWRAFPTSRKGVDRRSCSVRPSSADSPATARLGSSVARSEATKLEVYLERLADRGDAGYVDV